jgi:hypothetical protein
MTTIVATHKNADIQIVDNIPDLEYFKTRRAGLAARRSTSGFSTKRKQSEEEHVRILRRGRGRFSPGSKFQRPDPQDDAEGRDGAAQHPGAEVVQGVRRCAALEPDLGISGEPPRG